MTAPLDYPRHTLVSFGGTLREVNAGDEIWSCNVRCFDGDDGPGGQGVPDFDFTTALAALATALGTWYSDADNNMAGGANLAWVKLNHIGADGKYENKGTTFVHDYATPVAGGSTQVVPSYLSLCISWGTAKLRGYAHHGRIYPPNYTYNATGSAVSGADQLKAVATGQALLSAINISTGMNGGILTPAVVSPVAATWNNITRVVVGNIYDHQSRRRNAVAESYSAAAWPA